MGGSKTVVGGPWSRREEMSKKDADSSPHLKRPGGKDKRLRRVTTESQGALDVKGEEAKLSKISPKILLKKIQEKIWEEAAAAWCSGGDKRKWHIPGSRLGAQEKVVSTKGSFLS